jgi:hypothetical protein
MYRALLLAITLLVTVPTAAAAPTFVIVRDVSIGGFPRDATVARAIAVFGQPTVRRQDPQAFDRCHLEWARYGVSMETYHTGGGLDPCGPAGRHVSTTVADRRWRTSVGLKIGDTVTKLRRLYPRAEKDTPGVWWLTKRSFAGLPFPGLEAKVKNGRVAAFTLYGPRKAL